jgi:hypothetical protein
VQDGFKFFFYANEHAPKHVHVAKGDDYAKVELGTYHIAVHHMKPKDLKRALRIIREHNSAFEDKWDDWFRNR